MATPTATKLEHIHSILSRRRTERDGRNTDDSGHLGENIRIASINLIEPEKRFVESHQPGAPFERRVLAVLLDRARQTCCEAVVDLTGRSVISVVELADGIQPSIMPDEFVEVEQMVHRSPLFRER